MACHGGFSKFPAIIAWASWLLACGAEYAQTAASPGGGAGQGGRTAAGGGGAGAGGITGGTSGAGTTTDCIEVTAPPEAVRTRLALDPFYEKHVDAGGLSILASSSPSDEALLLACRLVINMLSERNDVREELILNGARFAIIGRDEQTSDIPEYGFQDRPQEDIDAVNRRTRGLGGIVASCGEENILCLGGDRYPRESICVHDFAHTIALYGASGADAGFEEALQSAYEVAQESGILDDTYRSEGRQSYFAEGVQDWYDTNDWSNPPNGIHNDVNTKDELEVYDPTLYALISSVFPEDTSWGDCKLE
jgi:alpha-glucosidase